MPHYFSSSVFSLQIVLRISTLIKHRRQWRCKHSASTKERRENLLMKCTTRFAAGCGWMCRVAPRFPLGYLTAGKSPQPMIGACLTRSDLSEPLRLRVKVSAPTLQYAWLCSFPNAPCTSSMSLRCVFIPLRPETSDVSLVSRQRL